MNLLNGINLTLAWLAFILTHVLFEKTWAYWHYLWLDIPMHLWGGLLVVTTWFYLQDNKKFAFLAQQKIFHPLVILVVMMVLWEIYRYLVGDIVNVNYVSDTILDLVSGTIGGIIAYYRFSSRTIYK